MQNEEKIIKVTADSGASLRKLREVKNVVVVSAVDLENGKYNKIKPKIGPVGVWGVSKWGDGSVWAGNDCIFDDILKIVGKNNIQDARQLEAHHRSGNDVFVSEDRDDILSKRDELKVLGIIVMSPTELQEHLINREYK